MNVAKYLEQRRNSESQNRNASYSCSHEHYDHFKEGDGHCPDCGVLVVKPRRGKASLQSTYRAAFFTRMSLNFLRGIATSFFLLVLLTWIVADNDGIMITNHYGLHYGAISKNLTGEDILFPFSNIDLRPVQFRLGPFYFPDIGVSGPPTLIAPIWLLMIPVTLVTIGVFLIPLPKARQKRLMSHTGVSARPVLMASNGRRDGTGRTTMRSGYANAAAEFGLPDPMTVLFFIYVFILTLEVIALVALIGLAMN